MAKNKLRTIDKALDYIQDDAVIMVGGFMTCGTPEPLMDALVKKSVKNLTVICNDGGYPGKGVGKLVRSGQVKTLITAHVGLNPEVFERMNNGSLELVLVPMGTLAERVRAGGSGLGGVLTPTGVGTVIAEGGFESAKQVININGRDYLLEPSIRADAALIYGTVCDEFGNTIFRGSTKNFNPLMATAADYVIVDVEKIVPTGSLDPDALDISGIFVDVITRGV
jgi:acetate CoA/acetoacetate CoA-transferase alpha subunit